MLSTSKLGNTYTSSRKEREKDEDEAYYSPRGSRQHSTLSGGEVDDSVVQEMEQLTIKRLQKQVDISHILCLDKRFFVGVGGANFEFCRNLSQTP